MWPLLHLFNICTNVTWCSLFLKSIPTPRVWICINVFSINTWNCFTYFGEFLNRVHPLGTNSVKRLAPCFKSYTFKVNCNTFFHRHHQWLVCITVTYIFVIHSCVRWVVIEVSVVNWGVISPPSCLFCSGRIRQGQAEVIHTWVNGYQLYKSEHSWSPASYSPHISKVSRLHSYTIWHFYEVIVLCFHL